MNWDSKCLVGSHLIASYEKETFHGWAIQQSNPTTLYLYMPLQNWHLDNESNYLLSYEEDILMGNESIFIKYLIIGS